MAALLNWIHQFCEHLDYFLKADDNLYVNVYNLTAVLHSLSPSNPSMPISDFSRRGKWPTNFQQWPWQRFPLYFHGPGIVITRSSIRPLLTAIQIVPYFVWDDMYLFGLCTDRAGVHRHLSNEFFINIPKNYTEPCFIRNSVMWMTQSAHVMNVPHNVSQGLYHHKPQTTRFEDAKTYITYNEPA